MDKLKAAQLMIYPVTCAEPKASIRQIGQQLLAGPYSGMPVTDESGQVIGMITEFDLLKAVGEGKDLAKTPVEAVMTTAVIAADIETPVSELMTLMRERKVRRLPITEQGRLVGMIARADVLRALFVPEFASYWLEWGQEPLAADF